MDNEYIRVAALLHEGLGIERVKVIFRKGGRNNPRAGNEIAYFMDSRVYHSIPYMQKAIPDDFRKFGKIDEALNTDIYDNK